MRQKLNFDFFTARREGKGKKENKGILKMDAGTQIPLSITSSL